VHRRKKALADEVEALRKAVTTQVGKEFDLDSPTETANVLRETVPLGEQAGPRVTLAQLEQLSGTCTLPRLIVKYRRVQKLAQQLETICLAEKDGKVFPIFSQIRWPHGSLSSTHPRICDPGAPLEASAVMDKTVSEHMEDSDRSLDILQRLTGDEVLKKDRCRGDHRYLIGTDAAERDLDQKDLLLTVAIGLSDAALSRRFLIDRPTVAHIRQALEAKYARMFKWLDIYRSQAMTRGFADHDGKRKYLEGLKSSNIDKRHKAQRSAVRWLIRY
jgi:DNA polymerase I-like protein with 3'-5' exonuclease and polymerase domains